jgi:lysophospholipase L1-like esterase
MVSTRETARNLAALREMIASELGASVHLVTPPPGDPGLITANFAGQALRWDAAGLDDIAAAVRELDPHCIDIAGAIGQRGARGLLEPDGVHLAPSGQRFVAETIVRQLAGSDARDVPQANAG